MRKVICIGLIVSLLAAGTWLARIRSVDAQSTSVAQSTAKPVSVSAPIREEISEELTYTGSLEAEAHVEVFANIPGKLVALTIDEGKEVKHGDVLARVESDELEFATKQAEAALIAARLGLADAQALAKIRVESQVAGAEAALSGAKVRLAQVKDLSYTQTTTQFQQAEAGLAAIRANLKKIREGARAQEKKQAETSVERARAGLTQAKSDYDRMKRLHEDQAISDQTFEAAQTQYQVASAQYEAAIQQLSLIKEGAREEDITAVEEQVRQAEAGLTMARKLTETKSWQKDIALAESQVKSAEAAFRSARALEQVKAWETEIRIAETRVQSAEVAYRLAQKRLTDATIVSPIDGIISARTMDIGDFAQAAGPASTHFLEIVNIATVKAVFTVPEVDVGRFEIGDAVLISTASQRPPVRGKIDFISPTVDENVRSVTVKATIPNPDHQLKPGMFIEVKLKTGVRDNALLIPRSAVLNARNGRGHIFVAENGSARKQAVQIGLAWGERVQVTDGITDATRVIVDGHRSLQDGQAISVVKR